MLYTVIEGQVKEELTAQQLLATRPVLVELYEYKNDVTIETRIECRAEKLETFPKRMQLMIVDYFEVGHRKNGAQIKNSNRFLNPFFFCSRCWNATNRKHFWLRKKATIVSLTGILICQTCAYFNI